MIKSEMCVCASMCVSVCVCLCICIDCGNRGDYKGWKPEIGKWCLEKKNGEYKKEVRSETSAVTDVGLIINQRYW